MSDDIRVTVQTCTYNRAKILHRVYDSLKAQTTRQFEWLVYNNGSTDETESLVRQWMSEADFSIRYFSTEVNAGIQNAFNVTVAEGVGEFWLMMDSDDRMLPNALERMLAIWDSIPASEQPGFSAVTVNCNDQHGNLVGNLFPESPMDSTSSDLYFRHKVRGEKFGMLKRSVLQEFPFHTSKEHVQPLAIWSQIGKKYKTRFVNESLRIYYIDEADRDDQISRSRSEATLALNAYGGRLNTQYRLEEELNYFRFAPLEFLKQAIFYKRYSKAMNLGFASQFNDLKGLGAKTLLLAAYPCDLIYKLFRS